MTFYSISLTAPAAVTSPCSSAPCYDVSDTCDSGCMAGGYVCTCAEAARYGTDCDTRDGGWTNWSFWSECFQNCNEQTRTRACTDPTVLGAGVDCDGLDTETRPCSDAYADCATHFGYVLEELTDVCDVHTEAAEKSIDDCVTECQDDIECAGVTYAGTICTKYEGKTKTSNNS